MNRLGTTLGATHVQATVRKIDCVPAQRHQFDHPQPMPIGDQHHGGVAVTAAILRGRLDQAVDLGVGEILARPDLGVAPPTRGLTSHCPIYSGWHRQHQMWFCHGFRPFDGVLARK
jgi:hypothetical protein